MLWLTVRTVVAVDVRRLVLFYTNTTDGGERGEGGEEGRRKGGEREMKREGGGKEGEERERERERERGRERENSYTQCTCTTMYIVQSTCTCKCNHTYANKKKKRIPFNHSIHTVYASPYLHLLHMVVTVHVHLYIIYALGNIIHIHILPHPLGVLPAQQTLANLH